MARTAVIVDAVRTPLGRRNGKLKDWHPVELAAVLQMFQIRVPHTYSVQMENARRMLASRRDMWRGYPGRQ